MVRKATKSRRAPSRKRATRSSPKKRSYSKTRTTYSQKKKYTPKPMKQPALSDTIRGSMEIYNNPFSQANGQAKIPDGKALLSVGARAQVSAQLQNAVGQDTLHVLLFPGISEGMVVFNDIGQVNTRGFTGYKYNNHLDFNMVIPYNGGTTQKGDITCNQKIGSWRTVSQGLKLSLLNTDEENDGWFEAIRLQGEGERAENYGWYSGGSAASETDVVFGPRLNYGNLLTAKSLVNSPTYMSGSLQDLGKHTFKLNPTTNDHDFKEISTFMTVEPPAVSATPLGNRELFMIDNTTDNHNIIDSLIDQSFDRIYIRIHCRSNTGAGSTTGSKILAHLCTNHELVYDEGESEHKFQTMGQDAGQVFHDANARQRKRQRPNSR